MKHSREGMAAVWIALSGILGWLIIGGGALYLIWHVMRAWG